MVNESFVTKVDGMICPQCEDEIAHRLLHTRGVLSCEASYRRSQVAAVYDSDIIFPDEIARILADTGWQKVKQVQHLNYGTLRQVSASQGIFWDEN